MMVDHLVSGMKTPTNYYARFKWLKSGERSWGCKKELIEYAHVITLSWWFIELELNDWMDYD